MLALLAICAIIQEVKRRELMERIKKGESSITVSGSDEFKEKAYASLEKLSKTPTGLGLLLELEKTGKSVEIVETAGGNSENPASMADGTYDRVNDQPGPGTSEPVLDERGENADLSSMKGEGTAGWWEKNTPRPWLLPRQRPMSMHGGSKDPRRSS